MKMIIRMLCAAALVFGAVSLTGCGDKDKGAKDGKSNNTPKTTQTSNGSAQGSNAIPSGGNGSGGAPGTAQQH